jgi:hypothetical protein
MVEMDCSQRGCVFGVECKGRSYSLIDASRYNKLKTNTDMIVQSD